MGNILVIGDVMLDIYIKGVTNRLSPEASCPVLTDCNGPIYKLGGAANVACILADSSYKVSLCGVIGKDYFGSKLIELSKEKGIDIRHLSSEGTSTTTKTRYLANHNQHLLRVDNDVINALPTHINENIIKELSGNKYDLVILSDYDKGVLSYEFSQLVLNICKKQGVITIVDIKRNPECKFQGATLIKGNEIEINNLLLQLNGNTEVSLSSFKHICKSMNIDSIVMTRGKNGIIGYNEVQGLVSHLSKDVPIYDVTGAGDVVTAFIAMLFLQRHSFDKILYWANLAAQIKVSQVRTSNISINDLFGTSKHLCLKKVSELRKKGPIVFTNGCFDILHAGHIDLLKQAKALGTTLIVGLNSDSSISRIKGKKRPVNNYDARFAVLDAIEFVDYIIEFDEDTPIKLIHAIKPDILVKGGDYSIEQIVGSDYVAETGGKTVIIPITTPQSSTHILNSLGYE